jgi:TrmH family RNA methyltransferase
MILASQIKSLQHPIVKNCVSLRKQASFKRQSPSVFILGKKDLLDLPSHIKILRLFSLDNNFYSLKAKEYYVVSEEVLKKISGVMQPEGLAAEVEFPYLPTKKIERLLVADGIKDPGNLGTLIRTALAFGFDALYLLHECVDPFNDKVVRSTKSALFSLPLLQGNEEEFLAFCKAHTLHLYQADLQGSTPEKSKIQKPLALILGSEAQGTSPFIKKIANPLTIPMQPIADSLNVAVAGGILMYNLSSLCPNSTTI